MIKNLVSFKSISLILNNILNLIFPTFFFFTLILSGRNVLSSEIAINTSLLILLTKSLTANQKNLIISSGNLKILNRFLALRIIMLIPILIFGIMSNFYFLSGNTINIIFIFIICAQWINEVALIKNELNTKKSLNIFFLLTNTIFFITIYFSCFYYYEYVFFALFGYLFHIIIFSIIFLKKNFLSKSFLIQEPFFNFFEYIKTNFFLSGFSLNVANFIWKISIAYLVGKEKASIFFAIFSIGSFPGTIFNTTFGAAMLKEKIKNFYLYFFYLSFIFIFIVLLFFLLNNPINFSLQNMFDTNFLIYAIFPTLAGSLIMLFSLYNRQFIINNNPSISNRIYKKDIILSVLISVTPVLLFLIGDMVFLGFSYFVAAVISYIIYVK
jgi:hypothetical protein